MERNKAVFKGFFSTLKMFRAYQMGYPNEEVKYGFLECLAPFYLNREKEPGPLDIRSIGAADAD